MIHSFGTFFFFCFILTITPGADTALVLKSSISSESKNVFMGVLGISTGLLFHATLSSLGLNTILQNSLKAYFFVKSIGALYLIFLGAQSLYDIFKKKKISDDEFNLKTKTNKASSFSEFRAGFITNLLNPKVAIFYLTFLPQFMNVNENMFLQSMQLASIHIAISFVWLSLIGNFVTYFRDKLSNSHVRNRIEGLTALALIGFGIRLFLIK